MKEGFGQTGSENAPDHSLYFKLSKAKHYPDNSGLATVFRLLSEMVRENLRILLNSKIRAVSLRVLLRTEGVGQPRYRMLPTLKSSPGLLDQCLKGIWRSMRGFSGTPLWSCKHQEHLCSWTIPGWHRAPGSDCWALGEDRVAAGFALGQQRQLW